MSLTTEGAGSNAIIIAASFDRGYAEQATVMLYSLLASNRLNRFDIFIFFSDLDPALQDKIQSSLSGFSNFDLNWMKIERALIEQFSIRPGHVNEYAYSRLYMCDILRDVNRLLYLDCDLLVLQDLQELWKTDLKDKVIGAIEDTSVFVRYNELSIPDGVKIFNSGVLLFDAKQWRERSCSEAVVKKLLELGDKALWWDQDGLNAALYNERLLLDAKWNIQSHEIAAAQRVGMKNIKRHFNASIIHFTGNLKPWNFKSVSPYKSDYYAVLQKTGFFRSHRPQNKTLVNIIRRAARNVLVFTGILKY